MKEIVSIVISRDKRCQLVKLFSIDFDLSACFANEINDFRRHDSLTNLKSFDLSHIFHSIKKGCARKKCSRSSEVNDIAGDVGSVHANEYKNAKTGKNIRGSWLRGETKSNDRSIGKTFTSLSSTN